MVLKTELFSILQFRILKHQGDITARNISVVTTQGDQQFYLGTFNDIGDGTRLVIGLNPNIQPEAGFVLSEFDFYGNSLTDQT